MFKFLRKYNRMLLAIFGVLLMITFLIPQAFNRFFREAGTTRAVVATVDDGKKVSGADWSQAQSELAIIERTSPTLGMPGLSPIQKPEHWYLLVREATAAGLIAPGDSVNIPDEQLFQIQQITQQHDPDFIRQTYAKIFGVKNMISLFAASDAYSDRRLKAAAEKYFSWATAQVVVLQPDKDKATIEPTEKEIADQMAKYADVLPGSGDMGFGYKFPDRLKMEWIKVSTASIRKAVEASPEFSSKNQQMHWLRYAKDPAKGFPPVEKTAVPEIVRKDLLDSLTKARTEAIALDIAGRLQLNRRGLPEKDGAYVLPADWQQRKLSFQQLASDMQATNEALGLPSYESTGDRWLGIADVAKLPGIGSATTDKLGNTPVSITQLVQATKEFKGAGGVIPIQQDIAGPPLKDPEGNLYVFRIIATDPSHAPRSVDEVRDSVVADLKKASQYQQLVDSSSQIEQEAETSGLLATALDHDTSVQKATAYLVYPGMIQYVRQLQQMLSVTPAQLPVIGADRATNEAILSYADSLPPSTAVDDLTEAQRVFTVPVKNKMSLLVVRLTGHTPLSREDFAELVQSYMLQSLLATDESKDKDKGKGKDKNFVAEAFGLDALVKRNKFAFSHPSKSEDDSGNSATAGQSPASPPPPPEDSAAATN